MHGSKLALTVWVWAAYLMATHSNGISALQLQKQLGIGSYRSAWLLAAKLRRAMVDPDRNPLSGLVEIDETSLPFRTRDDPPAGGPGRSHDGKLLVVGAVEIGDGNTPGRLRLARIASYGAGELNRFIGRDMAADGTAKTDGWAGYARVPVAGHQPHVVGAMAAHVVLPWIHQVCPATTMAAAGACETPWPSHRRQPGGAGLIIGEHALEGDQAIGEAFHGAAPRCRTNKEPSNPLPTPTQHLVSPELSA